MCGEKRWVELCEQATVKQDSKKLLELTREINRLLTETQNRIDNLFEELDSGGVELAQKLIVMSGANRFSPSRSGRQRVFVYGLRSER
jgi:hypothetical protein